MPEVRISGGAMGADTLARQFAEKNNIPIIEFFPKYSKNGRKAHLMRNIKIVENYGFNIAFCDGKVREPNSQSTMQILGNPVRTIRID